MNSLAIATRTVLSKYATFSGRATRSEFWWWALAVLIIFAVTRLVDGAVILPALGFEAFQDEGGQPLSVVVALILIIPNMAVGVRRLHDIGRTGWWLLLGLVPVVGTLVLIYFYIQPSDAEENQFGPARPFAAKE